jgi:hypothetical protein
MKLFYIFTILLVLIFGLIGYILFFNENSNNFVSIGVVKFKITNIFKNQSLEETAEVCKLLCRKDADSYCEKKRIIEINNVYVTGTCRSFARKNNVKGFEKCEDFCSTYDKSGTFCELNGKKDTNCDGII